MRDLDPLRTAYRAATELFFQIGDMSPDIAGSYLALSCEGRDLVRSSVEALCSHSADRTIVLLPDPSSTGGPIAATLRQFASACASGREIAVRDFLPPARGTARERTLIELIKLDQKTRWSRRRPRPLELYLREWPELLESATAVEELLRSECLARAVFGTGATRGELTWRFPAVADAIALDDVEARARLVHRGIELGEEPEQLPLPERFTMLRELGRGGMGVVYEVTDRQRGSHVALKTLSRMDPAALFRFKREFRTLAGQLHENLVPLYELVSDGATWLFTMELVDGVDFITYIRSQQNRRDHALRSTVAQLASGLQMLHQRGILHCDLKPSNVLVRHDGRVVILDFGVAVQLSDAVASAIPPSEVALATIDISTTWTIGEEVMGTVAYISPEHAAGERPTTASDCYSIGVMIYEALTGATPFADRADAFVAKQFDDPPPPRAVASGVPADLEALCVALLDRNPEARPSAADIRRRCMPVPVEATTPQTPRSAPFVGRSAHLQLLADAFRLLDRHRVVTVHIRGRSGVGKTALAHQFVGSLPREAIVLTGRCYEQESVPYKALDSLVDALSRHLFRLSNAEAAALLPGDIAALARVFPVLERVEAVRAASRGKGPIIDVRELRHRAFDALAGVLERLGRLAPLVMLIDDLQWGDVDSAAVLSSVLGSPGSSRLLFIACYRSEHLETNPCLVALTAARNRLTSFDVDVDALTRDEALQLAMLLLETGHAGQDAAALIARESGGNPFFVAELARQYLQGSATTLGDAAIDLDEALWKRVTALQPAARTLLEVVSVAGKPLPLGSVADAAAIGEHQAAALATLHAERLVRTTGLDDHDEIETYHDRIRETVAHRLTEARRVAHHRTLALSLDRAAHPDAEEIASHFHRASMRREAAHHYAVAAERAANALAFDRSAQLFGLALEMRDADDAQVSALRIRRADSLANAGRGFESGREYQRAADGAVPSDVVTLQCKAGYQYFVSGHIDEGRKAFKLVLDHFGMKLPETRRRALLSLLWRRVRLQLRGMAFDERPEPEVRRSDLDRVDVFWSVAAGMTIADPIRGADFQTYDLILALRAGEPYRIARALAWDAAHVSMLGVRLRKRVMRQLEAAEALAARVDRPHALGMTLMSRGVVAYFHGDFTECQRCTEAAVTIFRDRCTGTSWELETCNAFALWPLYFRGEYAALTRRFARLIGEVRERGARLAEADLTTFGGPFVWLAADDPEGASRAVEGGLPGAALHDPHR
jgi:eukaryotic-like serine/threonine-protein kinase